MLFCVCMVYKIQYLKAGVKLQCFTSDQSPASAQVKINKNGDEYITVWIVERKAFRSLRCDRIISVRGIA